MAKIIFYSLFIVSTASLLVMGIYRSPFFNFGESSAAAFGITPPYIENFSILPGDSFKRGITLVRSVSEKDTYIKVKIKSDGFSDWINLGEKILFPAGHTRLPIVIDFDVPASVSAGDYSGSIYFINQSDKNIGVSVGLGAMATVELRVLSEVDTMIGQDSNILLKTIRLNDDKLYLKHKGNLLIDESDNYKTYYIHPIWHRAYFIENNEQVQEMLRRVSVPINRADIAVIPIAFEMQYGEDTDSDGLIDVLEEAIGTSKREKDTDYDGFSDREEIELGYDPLGSDKIKLDNEISRHKAGRFLVDEGGWNWYINPSDNMRYILGSIEDDLYSILRQLAVSMNSEEARVMLR